MVQVQLVKHLREGKGMGVVMDAVLLFVWSIAIHMDQNNRYMAAASAPMGTDSALILSNFMVTGC